jgi:hypothetical protein
MGIIQNQPDEPKWCIADTEFLLRLINDVMISGKDVEQAAFTITKLKTLHAYLLKREA